ncbi:MAG TPA: GGDEF domain-containing protein [Candidatus Eisenbacteria bacterium]|jgi:diguanylate cyclase (GGDEF)-like protein
MPGRERLLSTLIELTGRSGGRTRPEVLNTTLSLALALTEADGAVMLLGGARQFERSVLHHGEDSVEALSAPCVPTPFEMSLLRAHQPRVLADLGTSGVSPEAACPGVSPGPALYVPLRLQDRKNGYLAVHRHEGSARFSGRDARQLALLAAWSAVALDNLRLSENLERLAVTDDLTQVFNYRYLKSALRREVKRATRFRQDLSILMVDVDNLKNYNDRNGHLRGSFLLREIAQLFASQVRSWDLVAKYGGDEFTVILPQTDRIGAAAVAERLRSAVESHQFPLAECGAITVSTGIAQHPEDGDSVTGLIEAADRALYLAKRNGRNRVEGGERLAA